MPRLKRGSTALETARQRLAGLNSITPRPNFGPALDLDQYEREINAHGAKLDKYNETLSLLDGLQNDLVADEAQLREKNQRMLAAAKAHYGPNSNEYETVGGTRTSDRKRTNTSKKKTNTP
jgi:hypothetical protein